MIYSNTLKIVNRQSSIFKVFIPVLQVQEDILFGYEKPENHTIRCIF